MFWNFYYLPFLLSIVNFNPRIFSSVTKQLPALCPMPFFIKQWWRNVLTFIVSLRNVGVISVFASPIFY